MIHITGIGIDADIGVLNGELSAFEENLQFFSSCGFENVELSVEDLDIIINGCLQLRQVEKIRAITTQFPFVYTVHAPLRLNLAFPQSWPGHPAELEREQEVFVACLDFCEAIGANVMVYHSGLIALHQFAFGISPFPNNEDLELARKQEVMALRELMPLAVERGVTVAMENRDPHPWEVAIIMQAGLHPHQLSKYHAGMLIPQLIRQVEAVNHSHFGLTLDFGHLFLAANYCGFDYLEAIRQASPYIRHLHSSDNFGRLGGVFEQYSDRLPYGDGDTHIPPGWGAIPYRDALHQLGEYHGLFVLEINGRFRAYYPEALETMKRLIRESTQA
jgi:sugar phosphate isomerase/epimerase